MGQTTTTSKFWWAAVLLFVPGLVAGVAMVPGSTRSGNISDGLALRYHYHLASVEKYFACRFAAKSTWWRTTSTHILGQNWRCRLYQAAGKHYEQWGELLEQRDFELRSRTTDYREFNLAFRSRFPRLDLCQHSVSNEGRKITISAQPRDFAEIQQFLMEFDTSRGRGDGS